MRGATAEARMDRGRLRSEVERVQGALRSAERGGGGGGGEAAEADRWLRGSGASGGSDSLWI